LEKRCPGCKELKILKEFLINSNGYYTRCKKCKGTAEKSKKYYNSNKDKIKEYNNDNKDKINKRKRELYKERSKFTKKTKEEIKIHRNIYMKKRMKDPNFKLIQNLRNLVYHTIKNNG